MKLFQPDLYVQSVTELTPDLLQGNGIRSLLLDVDSTLKRYRSETLENEAERWLGTMKQAGIRLCIMSNGKAHRIRPLAESLQIPFIAPALKPLPFGCNTALKMMNLTKESTAIVGDQVFADVLAGKFAGIKTVLVKPIHPEEEHWYTRIKRPLEKLVLRKGV